MGYFKTSDENRQLYFTYLTFMLNGLLALSLGSLLPFIRESRGFHYGFAGMIVSLHSAGNLAAGFAAGALPAVIGRKKSILLLNACFALAYVLIIAGRSNGSLALAFFMTGLARGASSNFANFTINSLAPGKAGFLNGLHAMFSVGAFSFPVFLTVLTQTDRSRWIYACYFMVCMGILSWILYYLIPVKEEDTKKEKAAGYFGFLRDPLFYICTLILFFYLCVEQGVIGWLITYFTDTGLLSDTLSQLMASILWIMMLAGRLTSAWAAGRMRKEKLLLIMGAGFVCFFFWLLCSRHTVPIVIGIIGFGYSMAGIYPTTVSFCGKLIQRYSLAWSFILTAASLGSILMPSMIGRIAQKAGIASGMSSIVVVVIIDMALIVLLNLYVKKAQANELSG